MAQSYGKGDFKSCKIYRNQYIFLCACVMIILSIPLIFVPYLLVWIGQNAKLIDLASEYVWIVLPGIFFSNQGIV